MKAKVRKMAQELMKAASRDSAVARLKEQFEKKGFLSKRELRELEKLTATRVRPP